MLTFGAFTSFPNRLLGPKVHTVRSPGRHWTAFQIVACSRSRRMSVSLCLYRHCRRSAFRLPRRAASVVSDSVPPHRRQPQAPPSWDSPGRNTRAGCHRLLRSLLSNGPKPVCGCLHRADLLFFGRLSPFSSQRRARADVPISHRLACCE